MALFFLFAFGGGLKKGRAGVTLPTVRHQRSLQGDEPGVLAGWNRASSEGCVVQVRGSRGKVPSCSSSSFRIFAGQSLSSSRGGLCADVAIRELGIKSCENNAGEVDVTRTHDHDFREGWSHETVPTVGCGQE